MGRPFAKTARSLLLPRWMPATSFERQIGPLDDAFNEWSVVAEEGYPQQRPSPELLRIAVDAVARALELPETFLPESLTNDAVRTWPGEHYRLLPALCDVCDARRVVEIGTWEGRSAASLAMSDTVERVDTFDVVPWNEISGTVLGGAATDRVTAHTADLVDAPMWEHYQPLLAQADLIFVDGPKDGRWEPKFFDLLVPLSRTRRQLVVIDDTRLMPMIRLWRSLPPPKLDLTSFGHFSGTGLLLLEAS